MSGTTGALRPRAPLLAGCVYVREGCARRTAARSMIDIATSKTDTRGRIARDSPRLTWQVMIRIPTAAINLGARRAVHWVKARCSQHWEQVHAVAGWIGCSGA